jgi:Fe-S-cluster containining protein
MDFRKRCKTCSKASHCCIFKSNLGFTFIGISDAKRIRSRIKKDYDYFLEFSPLKKRQVNALKNCDPSLEGALRLSELDKNNRILRLKTKEDGRCIFLNNRGVCDVYTLRPNVCRIYPFWGMRLISGRIKIIAHDESPNCPIIGRGHKEAEEILSKKQILELKGVFKCIEKEDIFYKKATLQGIIPNLK